MEKIKSIEELHTDSSYKEGEYESSASGFRVVTDKQSIDLLIGNQQSCCENWGYFFCNEDAQEFVGADLLDVTITDEALNTKVLEDNGLDLGKYYEGRVMFVNLETSKGTLQFVAYNLHNGYYGHQARVKSTQLTHSEYV